MAVDDTETGLITSIIIASLLAIISITLSIYVIFKLFKHPDNIIQYFTYSIIFTVTSGALTSIFNFTFCVSEHVDPYDWFIHGPKWWLHQSFLLRLITTCLWYLQKIGLFYIFNGRLYYVFITSAYAYNPIRFWSLNIITPIIALSTLFLGYYAVIYYPNQTLISIGFQSFRIWWIFISLLFIFSFNIRLLNVCLTVFQYLKSLNISHQKTMP